MKIRLEKNVINEKTDYDEKNKNYILDNLGQHFVFNALNTIKGAVITVQKTPVQ